ncbi:unnamed protein product [Parascedosporium putredinis]|uniref:Uncharacterized protein n=1 Tax=Parascedosporium putredinis TaxID=1442378 RepID=A0A9P1ME94_9PEZI|nr:unnamed protein product [Parascedosporium putredinis]CAI8005167.1 unnamed protein product [Parascedosporium putredinis]
MVLYILQPKGPRLEIIFHIKLADLDGVDKIIKESLAREISILFHPLSPDIFYLVFRAHLHRDRTRLKSTEIGYTRVLEFRGSSLTAIHQADVADLMKRHYQRLFPTDTPYKPIPFAELYENNGNSPLCLLSGGVAYYPDPASSDTKPGQRTLGKGTGTVPLLYFDTIQKKFRMESLSRPKKGWGEGAVRSFWNGRQYAEVVMEDGESWISSMGADAVNGEWKRAGPQPRFDINRNFLTCGDDVVPQDQGDTVD